VVRRRNAPQKHVWRARIVLLRTEGCLPQPPHAEEKQQDSHDELKGPVAIYVGIDWRIFGRHEAIRSCGAVNDLIVWFLGEALPSVDLAHDDLAGGEQRQNSTAAVSAQAGWGRKRVKVNSLSPASSRPSATAWHFSRHLRMKASHPGGRSGGDAQQADIPRTRCETSRHPSACSTVSKSILSE
jgi:hypothetical protein